MEAEAFMDEVGALAERAPALAPLGAATLVALAHGIVADTRSFAKIFGVAHALALRAAGDLADLGFAVETGRDPRTQRARLALTEAGRRLVGLDDGCAAA